LHLTVGIECQTGIDWLNWLVQHVQDNPEWRQSLPAIVDDNTGALEQQLMTLRQQLIEALNHPDLLHQYRVDLSYRNHPPLPVSLPTQMGTDLFPNLFMTMFARSPLHRIRIQSLSEDHYQVHVGSRKIDLKGISKILVENLFDRDEFSLLDVADWAPDLDLEADIAPILARLVSEGILQVKAAS
jgi:hypothetical protein